MKNTTDKRSINRDDVSAILEAAADNIFLARQALEDEQVVSNQTISNGLFMVQETLRNLSDVFADAQTIVD